MRDCRSRDKGSNPLWTANNIWWRGLNRLQCHVVSVCGCRFESDLDRKEKEINLINKTYENIETKTLNVYVSIEQLVFEFFQ